MSGPVKRSITIAGHQTSISLEPVFWTALEAEAVRQALPLSALVARIDADRIAGIDPDQNLSGLDPISFFHQHLRHLAGDFGADALEFPARLRYYGVNSNHTRAV